MSFCTDPDVLSILKYVDTLITVAKIAIPLVIIVLASIDFAKIVMSGSPEKVDAGLKKLIYRVISAVIVFFVPTIVSIVFGLVDNNIDIFSCFDNIQYLDYYKELAAEERAHDENNGEFNSLEQRSYSELSIRTHSTSSSKTGAAGSVSGQKYDLTDSQLRGLAAVCQREQGNSAVGAAAEASLMANLFELRGSKYGTGGAGLYNYVADSGWFGNARSYMSGNNNVSDEVLTAVKKVLVLGNRTLPLYVDEHDCIDCGSYGYNVVKIVTDGKTITDHAGLKNHNNYIKDRTVIYNSFGSVYTFHSFPTEAGDPFGYTENALNTYKSMNGHTS